MSSETVICSNGHTCSYEWGWCPWCGGSLTKAKYKLRLSRVEHLSLTEDEEAVKEFFLTVYNDIPTSLPSIDKVEEVVTGLRDPIAQMVIRRFGLDGRGQRRLRDIGEEFGESGSSVSTKLQKAYRRMNHPSVKQKLFP